jgi:hydroxymethylbilane synthase
VKTIRIGTRGSKLALAQSNLIIDFFKKEFADLQFEIKIIRTHGDEGMISEVGAFVKSIENALLKNEIEVAVHSSKDMPAAMTPGLVVAAYPQREDVRDVFISSKYKSLKSLPTHAKIGTGSPRRTAQLSFFYPQLSFLPIQGNVDSRIRKMEDGDFDAIVLAAAGLNRLQLGNKITEYISLEEVLPAPGQGAIAVQCRGDDEATKLILQKINHLETQTSVEAEKIFLNEMGGGCLVPYACFAKIENDKFTIKGSAPDVKGNMIFRVEKGEISGANDLARTLARELKLATNE